MSLLSPVLLAVLVAPWPSGLPAAGMKIVLADVEEGALKKTEGEMRTQGATTLSVVTDVSQAAQVDALARKTLDTFGAVHIVYNNAGVGGDMSATSGSYAQRIGNGSLV